MRPLYIFDLDGTLALIEHRRHFVEDGDKRGRKDWPSFYQACDKDVPNDSVIRTMEGLRAAGADIWIFSGRSDEVRAKTVVWLAQHTSFMSFDLDTVLTMRKAGDYTADDELKAAWYDGMSSQDQTRLVATFDDRDRIVAMWRKRGVTCFQVADGDF